MAAINSISADKLHRLIGIPNGPAIIDVQTAEDFAADPRLVPGAVRCDFRTVAEWGPAFAGRSAVVVCQKGQKLSEGVAAWLRHAGVDAESLDGGALGWAAAGYPMVPVAAFPSRDTQDRTVWVTRARPKVDRIACPWLIRRFVDPDAVFLFVAASEVLGVADRFGATPFDVEGEGVVWSHDGERCTFDVMVDAFGLSGLAPMIRLAAIVRGADTGHPEIAPEAAGLVALSLGLSRMYSDDLEQLEAGMVIYDALYRWCRDATDETHNWESHTKPKGRAGGKA